MKLFSTVISLILVISFTTTHSIYSVEGRCTCYKGGNLEKQWKSMQSDYNLLSRKLNNSWPNFVTASYNTEYKDLYSKYNNQKLLLDEKYGKGPSTSDGYHYSDYEALYYYLDTVLKIRNDWELAERTFKFERGQTCGDFYCEYSNAGASKSKYHEDIEDIKKRYLKWYGIMEARHRDSDILLREIMEKCMMAHKNPRTFREYGYYQFQRGNYESAMRASRTYLSLSKKPDRSTHDAATYFLLGLSESHALEYQQAVDALTKAIEADPNNSEAYVERAIAYFELGNFDLALSDFLSSGFGLKNSLPKDPYHLKFALGFLKGSPSGLADGIREMPASLMSTLHGIGRLLWAGVSRPIDSYGAVTEAIHEMIIILKTQDAKTIAKNMVPELKDLLENWDTLDPSIRGEKAGFILGKYGIEVIIPAGAAKTIKNYQNLRRANAICTLETMAASAENKIVLGKLAQEIATQREHFFKNVRIHVDKQGKHIVGHKNYDAKIGLQLQPSILTHPDPEKLLQEFAGKGAPRAVYTNGAGYREAVDFKEYIGEFFDKETMTFKPTTRGTIHYDKNGGAHIVPASPEVG